MKRLLSGVVAMLFLGTSCTPIPLDNQGTGDVAVSVTQALSEVTPDTIDRIVLTVYAGSGPSAVFNGTHELGYNGSEWTTLVQGIPAGQISVTARAYAGGHPDPVFESNPTTVIVTVGTTASVRIVLHQVALQEGINAPVIDSITTSDTVLHPNQMVDITVCVTDPDGDAVTLNATSDGEGGTFNFTSVPIPLVANYGCATVGWTAPPTPSGLLPEEIELEVTDSSGASVRLQLFFRVIWESEQVEVNFELNLAPVVTSLRVAPANPVDDQGTPLVLGAQLGSLTIGFTAFDPDGKSDETLQYSWDIPEDCGEAWQWFRLFGVPIAPEFITAAGDLGTGSSLYSKDHDLAFPLNPAHQCTLTLTVTDGEGLSTTSTLVINPFEIVTHYTPTLEISYQNGTVAMPDYVLDFGVVSFLRLYDDYVGAPLIQWRRGECATVAECDALWEPQATPVPLPPTGIDLPFASHYRWEVTATDEVACRDVGGTSFAPIVVRACNPVHTELCNEVEFLAEVPAAAGICR